MKEVKHYKKEKYDFRQELSKESTRSEISP